MADAPPLAVTPAAPLAVPPTVPLVNDAYWFGFSKSLIDSALKSRDDAAATLQVFVGWLWTVYTAGAVVGINVGKLSLGFWPSVLIGSPVIALIAVYWMTIWVRIPEVIEFDPRLPKDIERAYNHNIKEKQGRLHRTLVWTAFAGALAATAIVYASVASSTAQTARLNVQVIREGDTHVIYVSGNAPEIAHVLLTVYQYDGKQRGERLASEDVPTDKGLFRAARIPVTSLTTKMLLVEVDADLKDSSAKMLLSKEVPLDSLPKP